MRIPTAIAILGLGVLLAAPATAQQVEIQAAPPPTPPEARVVPPPLHYETTRPTDADNYPEGTRVGHDPAFIEPMAGAYETATGSGRAGLSGWTAPNTPVGAAIAGYREVSGWFALGFTVTWDGPPPAPAKRPVR